MTRPIVEPVAVADIPTIFSTPHFSTLHFRSMISMPTSGGDGMTRRWRRSTGLGLSVACATGVLMLGAATAASPAGGDTAPTVNARAFAGHGDLAFVSNGTLYVLDGATGALRRVADLPLDEGGPQFSPNGQWLLYPGATATSFLARSDGTGARKLPGSANWLPDGDLSVSTGSAPKASVVGSNGTLHPAPSSASSARPVGTGTEYVYETSTLQVTAARKPAHGVVRV